jgi:hypothetical protein
MLVGHFIYVDAMIVDTPIVDTRIRARITDARRLADRLDRAELFCSYLHLQWQGIHEAQVAFDGTAVIEAIKWDIASIRARLARAG